MPEVHPVLVHCLLSCPHQGYNAVQTCNSENHPGNTFPYLPAYVLSLPRLLPMHKTARSLTLRKRWGALWAQFAFWTRCMVHCGHRLEKHFVQHWPSSLNGWSWVHPWLLPFLQWGDAGTHFLHVFHTAVPLAHIFVMCPETFSSASISPCQKWPWRNKLIETPFLNSCPTTSLENASLAIAHQFWVLSGCAHCCWECSVLHFT